MLLPSRGTRLNSGTGKTMREIHTPELSLPRRGSVELPTFTLGVPGEDDGIMADFLRDEVHSRILERFG